MDMTLKDGDNGHSLEKRRADDLDEEERQLEALIEEVHILEFFENLRF